MNFTQACVKAQAQSEKYGCVQHVNVVGLYRFVVSDWFDSSTVISYERGKQL